jgi:uncharacterized integral membrane protein
MTEPAGTPGSHEPPPRPERRQRSETRAWLVVIGLALATAYLIWFAIDNTHSVEVHWVFGTTRSALLWVILVTLILGVLIGWLARLYGRRRRRAKTPDR